MTDAPPTRTWLIIMTHKEMTDAPTAKWLIYLTETSFNSNSAVQAVMVAGLAS